MLSRIASVWQRRAQPAGRRLFSSRDSRLLTHVPAVERPTFDDIAVKLNGIMQGLQQHEGLSALEKARLADDAKQLSEFEFGRFLIANQGALSGWWTYYCIIGYRRQPSMHPLERFLLEEAPTVLATRERFGHFQHAAKQALARCVTASSSVAVASIPGGVAADLSTLDVNLSQCRLRCVSVDLDASVAALAKALAKEHGRELDCICEDAWNLSAKEDFDIVMSNGLNIYEPDRGRVVELYRGMLNTLKPGGTLITSALTPPPASGVCEWNAEQIDADALARQAGIFGTILGATWSNFCTTDEMQARLREAGVVDIEVTPDRRNMFPTFVGRKPCVS